mgnify:CR=1 FL=1
MRNENPGGRPRIHANDAEKARAFRENWGTISVRAERRTVETLELIAKTCDASKADIVSAALKFYALNFDEGGGWKAGLIFGKRLPTLQDPRYREQRAREDANREFLNQGDE